LVPVPDMYPVLDMDLVLDIIPVLDMNLVPDMDPFKVILNPILTCVAPSLCPSASSHRLDSFKSHPKHTIF
jgi:hypothetical protein